MKVTEKSIREAMKLKDEVAVTLGTLDEPGRTRIAIVARSVYTVRQIGYKVEMLLQFAAHDKGILGYPSIVTFYLGDPAKLDKMAEAVSAFVSHLQSTGQDDAAAKVAAILTLPCEDIERVYDALTAGLSKEQFIAQIEEASGANISKGFVGPSPFQGEDGKRLRLKPGGVSPTRHLYDIGVGKGGQIGNIEVEANNRTQAAKIATDAGFEVRDVNMTG